MNQIDLKYKIEQLYSRAISIQVKPSKDHPVRIVQSVKSIIGISPEHSYEKLLLFCENHLSKYNLSESYKDLEQKHAPEVIAFSDFESSLKNKNLNDSVKNVSYLLTVSDAKHVLEFLVEFSLKYNIQSFYSIWSVYKMMLFLQGKDILGNIFFCINLIINDSSPSYVNYGNSNELDLNRYPYHHDFTDMIWIYYSIIKEYLVRKENIKKYIYNNLNAIDVDLNYSSNFNVLSEQKSLGRKWISDYILKLDYQSLDAGLLLMLEACRASLKVSLGKHDDIIWDRLNTYLNEYR